MSDWIVVVDDEPFSLTNAKNLLRAHGMRVSCLRSGEELLEFMAGHTPDLILLDILMPGMDGFETYRTLRRFEHEKGLKQLPVIFLTGEDNNETERRGLKAGASDYIHKPFDEDILINRIRNTIENSKTIENLTEEASVDKLTGFLNRASGTEKVTKLCRKSAGALMILDLDNFKLVNDIYGHDMGDRVLEAFADVIRQNTRSGDIVCRIGGDEFMTYFADMTEEEPIASLTRRLNKQFRDESDRLLGKEHGVPLGISVGVAISTVDTDDYQILFKYADSALYEVKLNGKHDYHIYSPDTTDTGMADNDLEHELERVVQIMTERSDGKGAMVLGQEAFSWSYRFVERFLTRYGGTATRVLFSVTSDERGVIFSEMVSEFGNTLRTTLRKPDMVMRWQKNQFFVILPQLNERDTDKVIDRIMKAWDMTGFSDRVRIEYAVSFIRKDRYEPNK
jgi:diguanylate cyclase (GGDEF)-like protein